VHPIQASEDLSRLMAGEAHLLSQPDRIRLCKLMSMLGSEYPNKRDNAACAIGWLCRERGLRWAEIFWPRVTPAIAGKNNSRWNRDCGG
jgi:hypothetical protein